MIHASPLICIVHVSMMLHVIMLLECVFDLQL